MTDAETPEFLAQENEKLRRQNAIKSDLISISAHQLRTSLSAMKWILKMLYDGDFGEMNPEQKNFTEKALDSNNRMIGFVNEMLSMNHTDDTLDEMKIIEVDLTKMIDELIFDFSGEAYKKGTQIIFLKPETKVELQADKEKIRVVIQNLIENAIKYSGNHAKIIITLTDKDHDIEISVHDNGIGIMDTDKDKIFGKFYRTDNAKKQDSVGSGLGLFVTRRIVEKHHGRIWFESKKDDGTTFFVEIPK